MATLPTATLNPWDSRARLDVDAVALHLPQVAELVLGSGGGPGGLVRLHGQARHHQALGQFTGGGASPAASASGFDSDARSGPCTRSHT